MPQPHRPHRELAVDSSHWRKDGRAKTSYATRADALSAAEERRSESGVSLAVYQCPYCRSWHMGSRSTTRRR